MSVNLNDLGLGSPPYIMGVLNCTPDSFSDGGRHLALADAAHAAGSTLLDADILDIGGEASGPGSRSIGAEAELSRIADIVAQLAPSRLLSIDTFRADTATVCLSAGAKIINDISALRFDPKLAAVIREHSAYVVLMYSKESASAPHVSDRVVSYVDVVTEIGDFLEARVEFALSQGISEKRIIIDPGMGAFVSGAADDSWRLLAGLDRLTGRFSGLPMLVGTSRKGFLGGRLADRDPISQLTALIAKLKGATILRTHNPAQARLFLESWQRTMG